MTSLKANLEKFQFMIFSKKQSNKVKLKINLIVINESDTVNYLELLDLLDLFRAHSDIID